MNDINNIPIISCLNCDYIRRDKNDSRDVCLRTAIYRLNYKGKLESYQVKSCSELNNFACCNEFKNKTWDRNKIPEFNVFDGVRIVLKINNE